MGKKKEIKINQTRDNPAGLRHIQTPRRNSSFPLGADIWTPLSQANRWKRSEWGSPCCWCLSLLSTISLVGSLAFETFSMRLVHQTTRSSVPCTPSKQLLLCHLESQLQWLSVQFLQKVCCLLLHLTLGANEAPLADDVTMRVSFLRGRFLVSM